MQQCLEVAIANKKWAPRMETVPAVSGEIASVVPWFASSGEKATRCPTRSVARQNGSPQGRRIQSPVSNRTASGVPSTDTQHEPDITA